MNRHSSRAAELLWLRRVRLLLEVLEDRSTPSATALDPLDVQWLASQQLTSLQSDVVQICEMPAQTAVTQPVALQPAASSPISTDPLPAATTIQPVYSTGPSADPALAASQPHEVIVVDSSVADLDSFLAQLEEGLPPGTWYDIYVIDSTGSGVDEVSDILSLYDHSLDAVHIFSHASSGELQLGSDFLDSDSLDESAAQLAGWQNALKPYGDLLLYGCDVAAGDDGAAFVQQLHQLTGLEIAASSDETGSADLGGDWVLESQLGEIGAAPLGLDQSDAWTGLLNTYTVTNRNDSGSGSLRQAILNANANAGADTITFAIVGTGTQSIDLNSALPTITDTVTIDGTTQLLYLGTPLIVLNGNNAGVGADGLTLGAGSSGSEIRGLSFARFEGDAIVITGGSSNNVIAENYIGTDTGTSDRGNGGWGVNLSGAGANNVIGGTTSADGNVIVGNDLGGINLSGSSVTNTLIQGNKIGVGSNGTTAIGNTGGGGIVVQNNSADNTIGGTAAGQGNTIANNSVGIAVFGDPSHAVISGNSIYNNVGLGIDLENDGVTLNDVNDGDSGGNLLKNFPTLTAADTTGASITISGSLNSVATGSYQIEFFSNPTGDPSGYGEGRVFLGSTVVTTDAAGNASFTVTLSVAVAAGSAITATNTDLSRQVTSEFSQNLTATSIQVPPSITSNGGGASASISRAENGTSVTTVTAVDSNGDPLTYSISGGADAALFTINASTGVLTFVAAPNFEAPLDVGANNIYSVTVQVSDGRGGLDTQTLSITVTNVNEAPVAGNDSYSVNEDTTLNIPAAGVLSNDTDPEGDPRTAVLVSGPTRGTLTLNADGSFTYTPNSNYNGPDSFTYRASDGSLTSNLATVTLTVNPVNDAPVAVGNSYSLNEDTPLSVTAAAGVLANDTDVDSATLTAVLVSGPTNGSLTLNANGSFLYTPAANYNGPDSFTYRASDGSLSSNVVTVSLTVNPVNDAPVATADSYSLNEDTPLVVGAAGVLANDSDLDGPALSAVLVAGPSNGSLTLNANGSFTYTPAANFNGSDSFTYRASDGSLSSNVVTVSLTVAAVNDAPVAAADSYAVNEDGSLTAAASVLANDGDVDSPTLTALLVAGPTHGSLTLNSDGTFTYTPAADYNGPDSFTYQASDGSLSSNVATVSLTVNPVNDAPVAANDSYSLSEDTPLVVAAASGVLANDGDIDGPGLSAVLVSGPTHGSLTLNANGSFTYTPSANYNGADSFTYRASDGSLTSNVVTVSLTVNAVNDAPVAANDAYSLSEDMPLTVAAAAGVLANDTDIDSPALSAALVAGPTHGLVTLNADGSFTYTPDADYNGPDSFTYRTSDGPLSSNVATVTLTIGAGNDAPVAVGDSYSVNEDTPLTVSAAAGVLANDSDIDGPALSAILLAGPTHGSLTLNANGSFTYTANADYNGADSFTYQASDGSLVSNVVTVSLTVIPVNDAPVAAADSYTLSEDTPLTVAAAAGVLANDGDIDSASLTAVLVAGPAQGTVTLNADGSFTYTPNADFNGPDSFTYQASDGGLLSSVVTVSLTVLPVNDAPVAANDAYTLNEDTPLTVPAAAGVLANDGDVDSASLSAVLVSGPTHGSLTWNADGSFSYTPDADYNGPDSFTYQASDGSLASNIVTVSLTIVAVNDAPVAAADAYTLSEDVPLTVAAVGVLGNDFDIDSPTLTAVLVSGPTNGTVMLNADGSFTYTPNADFNGVDSFTYQARDGSLVSTPVTVTLTVLAVNDAPVAVSDSYTLSEDTPLGVAVGTGVLANDGDIDSPSLSAVLVTGPSHGTLTLNADGSFLYTPDADYNGSDSFTYQATDGSLLSGVATVSLTVTAVNDAPVAAPDSYTLNEDTPLTVSAAAGVLTNDGDIDSPVLSAVLVTGPSHGSLTLNADGSFTYTPAANYNGVDSFTYQASDGSLLSNAVTVSFNVIPVNDAPVAAADAYTLSEDTPLVVVAAGVLSNDGDIDSPTLTAVLVSGPTHGSLTLNADGSFLYTPDADFNGPDSFTYQASDGSLVSNVVTVSLTVNAVNDAPVAGNDALTLNEDTPLVVVAAGVLTNDFDVDSPALSVILVAGPTHGSLSLNPDGSFTYTPLANYNGPDSFTYQVSDGSLLSNVATVSLTINPVNDAPVAVADAYILNEDVPLVLSAGVLANDADVDSSALTAVLVTGPAHGTLTLRPDGSLIFTPDSNFNGGDSFTYQVSDGSLLSNVVTVTLTITAVNDAPVAGADTYVLNEDTPLTIAAFAGVLVNDGDIDSAALAASLVSGPQHGFLAFNADGSFAYRPFLNFNGVDSFTYQSTDGSLLSTPVTVTLAVAPVNDAPTLTNFEESSVLTSTPQGVPAGVPQSSVVGLVTDVDGDPLTTELVQGPSHGTLSRLPDGSFAYTPAAGFTGTDQFVVRVTDGFLTSQTISVQMNVTDPGLGPLPSTSSFMLDVLGFRPPSSSLPPASWRPDGDGGGGATSKNFGVGGEDPPPAPPPTTMAAVPQTRERWTDLERELNQPPVVVASVDVNQRTIDRSSFGTPYQPAPVAPPVSEIRSRFSPELWIQQASQLYQDLDHVNESLIDHSIQKRSQQFVVAGVSITLTGGYVLWNLRTFYILLSALTARPLWRTFDPLVVLDRWDRRKDDDDVEKLFD